MVRDPAEFSDRGFSPEEQEEWIAAVFWAEQASAWRDAGFEPEEAHVWCEAHVEPQDAIPWRALLTPLSTAHLKRSQHVEWHTWREVAAAAANWRHHGFNLADTDQWLKAGLQIHDSKLAAGYRTEGIGPDEARATSRDQAASTS
jgi:hypothetical protein